MSPKHRLRVLQVCSAREAVYGAAISLLTLARAQRSAGHRVEFATFKGKRFGTQVRAQGFAAHEFAVRTKIDPFAIVQMAKTIRQGRFNIVHTHLSTSSVNGTLAAKLARVPSVATVHGLSGKLSFAAADRLIAVSDEVKSHLMGQGVPASRIQVVYNGLDLDGLSFDADEARTRLGFDDAGPVLGTVARVTSLKGIEDGIRVASELRDEFPGLRYLVVGDGDAMDSCRTLANDLGMREMVHFAGYQPDVAPFLAAMDLFLFPSHKEAMGIALVEAMAAGLPIVATRVGGIPEVVTPETGVLKPAQDVVSLAEAARELLLDSPRRIELGANARARAMAVFSAQAMEEGVEKVYCDLLGHGPLTRRKATRRETRVRV
ncbi:glycosyltransferase family 1 protein [bacterium]|nr:MAG: glycosyltransferase family 1 protein [bacterium]